MLGSSARCGEPHRRRNGGHRAARSRSRVQTTASRRAARRASRPRAAAACRDGRSRTAAPRARGGAHRARREPLERRATRARHHRQGPSARSARCQNRHAARRAQAAPRHHRKAERHRLLAAETRAGRRVEARSSRGDHLGAGVDLPDGRRTETLCADEEDDHGRARTALRSANPHALREPRARSHHAERAASRSSKISAAATACSSTRFASIAARFSKAISSRSAKPSFASSNRWHTNARDGRIRARAAAAARQPGNAKSPSPPAAWPSA